MNKITLKTKPRFRKGDAFEGIISTFSFDPKIANS